MFMLLCCCTRYTSVHVHVIIIRLIEEVRDACEVTLDNDTVYMASVFGEFIAQVILKSRDGSKGAKFEYDAVSKC